jgi:hypothetical protein
MSRRTKLRQREGNRVEEEEGEERIEESAKEENY